MMKQKKKTKNKLGGKVWLSVLLALVIVYAFSVATDYRGRANGVSREVTVASGAGTAAIAESLQEAGIIEKPFWFRLFSKLGGHDGTFQQGVFLLEEHMGYQKIFTALKQSTGYGESVRMTIPEGMEIRQIVDKLAEKGLVDKERFLEQVEHGLFDYDFLRGLPKRENRLEGYLFPDTYMISRTDDEADIINMMLARFDEVYTEEYRARAKELGMTDDEIITLASVIEREAQGDADRDLVAGVFHNRLKNAQYPYLESCATVQYILKERKAVLSVADTKIDSPYNTYRNPGLPLGPIASPGQKSIEAALYPAQHKYLFFVLDSSGTHRFAETFAEHQENMKK